eukprot:GHVP01061969.1.p1 GENE.GHVP01061969.1~~GHVP01061969.1.p1  ORF type:complete len:107 (-),score=14.78 GHVP01061969.1:219-539(-)
MGAGNSSELFHRHLQFIILDHLPPNIRFHTHYIDDILIFHDKMHVVHEIVEQIKKLLEAAQLPINEDKSEKVVSGYRWTTKNIAAEESKINKLRKLWADFKTNRTE